MTFEQCHANLVAIRRRQGTRCPLVKVVSNGRIYQGRLTRADSDPELQRPGRSRFGVIVLENVGLAMEPETLLQIASIPEGGINDLAA